MDGPSDSLDLFASLAASVHPLPEEETRIGSNMDTLESESDSTASESDKSSQGRSSTSSTSSRGRRAIHNVCERRRRESIRDAFEQLRARVSKTRDSKTSKMDILRSAINFIRDIKRDINTLEAELSVSKRQHRTVSVEQQ